jgi:dUTP pyrophosphatase
MFRSGQFVADHIEGIDEVQVQPNGVDLTVSAVFEQVAPGHIGRDGKRIGDRRERDPVEGIYRLDPGFLYPRSSLLRNSCMLDTAVWDAGYEGRGEGLLEVYHDLELERNARIAQLVLAEAAHDEMYDGSYQGERLDQE